MVISDPNIYVFGRTIPLYGVCFYLGVFLAAAAAAALCTKKSISRFDLVCSAVYTMIGAMIGAKLLFVVVSLRQITELGIPFIAALKGGFVFYGGLLGGLGGLLIYIRQFKLPLVPFLDLYSAVLPLGHAVGRVGCFFAGCCYGMPYDGPLSCTYTYSVGTTPIGVPLFPVQLAESAALAALFAAQLACLLAKPKAAGLQIAVYVFCYPVIRFSLEFFRGDAERGIIAGLSTSQIISLLIVLIASVYLATRRASVKGGLYRDKHH